MGSSRGLKIEKINVCWAVLEGVVGKEAPARPPAPALPIFCHAKRPQDICALCPPPSAIPLPRVRPEVCLCQNWILAYIQDRSWMSPQQRQVWFSDRFWARKGGRGRGAQKEKE